MIVEISVRARQVSGFEYMAEIKLGEVPLWTGLVYGTEDDKTHSEVRACQNALLVFGDEFRKLLNN